jgi:hypothetical protein
MKQKEKGVRRGKKTRKNRESKQKAWGSRVMHRRKSKQGNGSSVGIYRKSKEDEASAWVKEKTIKRRASKP